MLQILRLREVGKKIGRGDLRLPTHRVSLAAQQSPIASDKLISFRKDSLVVVAFSVAGGCFEGSEAESDPETEQIALPPLRARQGQPRR